FMADYDNEQDLTGAIIAKIKQLFESRTALVAMAAVLAAILLIIFAAVMLSGGSGEEFETLSALAQYLGDEEDKKIHVSQKGLDITMRISDICSVDEESGDLYTSLYYSDSLDEKYVLADYIVKNKTSENVIIDCGKYSEESMYLFLGNFEGSDKWDKNAEDNFYVTYHLFDKASGDIFKTTEFVIGAKETKEFTLIYSFWPEEINKCTGLYLCPQCQIDDDDSTKYFVMGIGKPIVKKEFKNGDLFPQIIQGENAASSKPAETKKKSEDVTETTASLKYQMKKIGSNSPVFSMINNAGNPYKLSVEIAAAGNAESNLSAEASGYSAVMENESIQGTIVELAYTDGLEVEKVKLMFEIKDSAIENTLSKYTDTSDEFEGIKRFNVFMYDEELNMQLPIETKFDLENNIVYAETDRCGTYALVDMEIWFDMLTDS
ncbi:MAG: hypothetical protein K2H23_06720, partial [Oscillospiraceae bacterium]|nr:hypothetical protein [Oscillospiraceae bacterium]